MDGNFILATGRHGDKAMDTSLYDLVHASDAPSLQYSHYVCQWWCCCCGGVLLVACFGVVVDFLLW